MADTALATAAHVSSGENGPVAGARETTGFRCDPLEPRLADRQGETALLAVMVTPARGKSVSCANLIGGEQASKSADTAVDAQRSPSSRRRAVQDNRLRGPGPGVTEARLALPGQSTPGPDVYRACRQQERKRIIGQRDAPPYEGDLRLQRSTGREPTEGHLSGPQLRTAIRSIRVLSPPRRHPGSSPAGNPARQRRPSDSLHQVQRSCRIRHIPVSGLHTSADPTGDTEFPDLQPCRGRAPTRSRRSYRRFTHVAATRHSH